MYVLVHKERVLVGPRDWNRPMFEGALQKLKLETLLPRSEPQLLPIVVNEETYITRATVTIPSHNERTESYHGPYWDLTDTSLAVGTYQIKERPIPSIRELLKNEAATERRRREVSDAKVTIQDTEVTINMSREERNIIVQKYLIMGTAETAEWKFPEGWFILTKNEMGFIVSAWANHIQEAFSWEKAKNDEIDNAQTIEELAAIVITEPEEPLMDMLGIE
jgi:hypothetical protein